MAEHQRVEQALDALKESFILPINKQQLRKRCSHVLSSFKVNEEMNMAYLSLFTDNNFEAAKAEFFQKVKTQIDRWKPIFQNQRQLKLCLDSIQKDEFDIKEDDIKKLSQIFEEGPLPSKHELIERFIVYLAEMFIIIGDKYMNKYELSTDWRANYQACVTLLQDILLVAYRKYCKFYHVILEDSLKNIFQAPHIRTVEQIQKDFSEIVPSSIRDSAMVSLLKRKAKTFETMFFQQSMLKHDDNAFVNQRLTISQIFNTYKSKKIDFQFLKPNQAKDLCYILSEVFKNLDYTDKQKNTLKKILTKENLGLDIWAIKQNPNLQNIYMSQQKTHKTMICLIIALLKYPYTGIMRHFLQYTFRRLSDLRYGYSNYQVLVQLENNNLTYHPLLDLMRNSTTVVDKEIQQMLRTIKMQGKIEGDIPELMTFQKIGTLFTKSRVITLFISGFTCQDSANAQSWRYLLHKGQTYAMNWKCLTKSFTNMLKLSSVIPVARNTGKYLAHFIRKVLKNYIINMVGFSLGTEVICSCLQELGEDANVVNKIVLLGGVAHVPKLEQILGQNTVEVINCFTSSDLALKAGLALFDRSFKPCGLNQIGGFNVKHVDTTKISNWYGHRIAHIELRKYVEFETDLLYTADKNKNS